MNARFDLAGYVGRLDRHEAVALDPLLEIAPPNAVPCADLEGGKGALPDGRAYAMRADPAAVAELARRIEGFGIERVRISHNDFQTRRNHKRSRCVTSEKLSAS